MKQINFSIKGHYLCVLLDCQFKVLMLEIVLYTIQFLSLYVCLSQCFFTASHNFQNRQDSFFLVKTEDCTRCNFYY